MHDLICSSYHAVNLRTYSLVQVCVICDIDAERFIELVEFGVVIPAGAAPDDWRFPASAMVRARKALRLQHEFGLEQQGLAMAMELLDEIDRLRAELAQRL